MNSIAVSSIVLTCVFGGALFGMFLPTRLPEDHLSPKSTDLVKMGMGLIGTMAAMVLGLMFASAKNTYDTGKGELTALSAKVVMLDRVLAHYGPDAQEARNVLRGAIVRALDQGWTARSQPSGLHPPAGNEVLYDKIQDLSPQSDQQRSVKSQALALVLDVGQTQWLMLEQQPKPTSPLFLNVIVFWFTIIFISFGLLAPRNGTVVATLFVCALSVSGAIFLILEMYSPFSGVIRVSSDPLRTALSHLGK
jgi:hypothetical protein